LIGAPLGSVSNSTCLIDIKGGAQLLPFEWAADGKGFFVSIVVQQCAQLVHIDLRGNTAVSRIVGKLVGWLGKTY